jgi:hypothetical protein
MRRFVAISLLGCTSSVFAQFPAPVQFPPSQQAKPQQVIPTPGLLPKDVIDLTKAPDAPSDARPDVKTPFKEQFNSINPVGIMARRTGESWQVFAGTRVLADFAKNQNEAEDASRVIHELRPTEWASIGTQRAVVSYGVTNGKASLSPVHVRQSQRIDLKSLRAEQVRGVWVIKDDTTIFANFATQKADAAQAVAVAQKYGFNHIGHIGTFSFFYAAPMDLSQQNNKVGHDTVSQFMQSASDQNLARTGIPIPGAGFAGEQIRIDPRKVEVRKDKADYVLASGTDVLAKFGPSDWSARDALKVVQDCRFTEFCQLGDMTFFLVNGQAPTRVPFNVQGQRFDPKAVKTRSTDGRFGVFDGGGRQLFSASSADEAEQIVKIIQGYGFDMTCAVGQNPRTAMKFLAKTGGR